MKQKIANFLIRLYKKLVGRKPCVVYARPCKYTKRKDGFAFDCPFCNLNGHKIIKQYLYFYVVKNKYPYLHTKNHLLIVPKRHIKAWGELRDEEVVELRDIIDEWLNEGYLLLGRHFGKHKEATVEHLHIHIILEE